MSSYLTIHLRTLRGRRQRTGPPSSRKSTQVSHAYDKYAENQVPLVLVLLEWLLGAHAAHSVLRNCLENSVSQTGLITALSGLPLSSCCLVVMSMITFLGHNSIMTLLSWFCPELLQGLLYSCTKMRRKLFTCGFTVRSLKLSIWWYLGFLSLNLVRLWTENNKRYYTVCVYRLLNQYTAGGGSSTSLMNNAERSALSSNGVQAKCLHWLLQLDILLHD